MPAGSYILFQVEQFDSYSYLFNRPVFISLDPAFAPNDIPVAGMRIGILAELSGDGIDPQIQEACRCMYDALADAGAELKEAFEGVNMLWGSLELTPSLSLEALYLLEHKEKE